MHLWDYLLPGDRHKVQLLKLWQGNAREVLRQVASEYKAIWYVYNDGGSPAGATAHQIPEGKAASVGMLDAGHGPFFVEAVVVVEAMDDPNDLSTMPARRVTIWIR